ncbi:molybdopterin-synthase adenylyltransferase MoeB [Sphingomonas paeninsulae]|uniref:Molybdopterin-synthase adenylyltransferase MoeB n=1 Tax=Sphingomonas paeninsulae TaxID=2319844 RepID=A0A494T9D2_SPHPE|nr:molybdopterin-synthase adenylyltransferase MoeB [Sphingomonas paeninsulae]AYJ85977.1 molybdopterin-synthase adenylyltransferase MoeB [Sphingomonas paeninsulae]
MLSDAELERYARHIVLREIGGVGQVKLKAARVAVVGAGGIGCPALQYLVAAGVGRITLFDDDIVSVSNLQRQILFGEGDVGKPKAEVAAAVLARLNPESVVTTKLVRLDPSNVLALLAGHDVILDGTDSFASRLAVADAAYALKIPLVSAAIGQFHAQVATWRGWETTNPCYRCYVGDAFDAEDCDTCAELGVLGAMTGMIGSFGAMEAIRAITGFGDDTTGKLHLIDGLTPAMRTIRMPKDPACRTCGQA